ncbi:MAG: hypothetical protein MJ245_01785 [Clostridia bacterium]|nr:hypothetical protein [Clostridia bacterium]
MKKRYSTLLIFLLLLISIFICELFIEDEETIEVLPVNVALNYDYADSDTNVHINLFEINSKKKCAKIINEEIENLFITKAKNVINNKDEYQGTYQLASEYNFDNGYLSIKIYETDSNEKNTSGNIYSVVYDYKNDMQINLSKACDILKLDYKTVTEDAYNYAYNKNKFVNMDDYLIYINDKNQLELICRTLIQVDKYSFWNNIEIYEVSDKENMNE